MITIDLDLYSEYQITELYYVVEKVDLDMANKIWAYLKRKYNYNYN